MTVLDQATRRRAVQSFFVLLLLTFSSYASASISPISNVKSRRCSPDVKVHNRTERKLAAVPAPEPTVSRNAPAPSPSNPRPPSPPPNSRPALISPSHDAPGTDLPPRILSPPPASEAPITSPILASKPSNGAVILGVSAAVIIVVFFSFTAVACARPEWLQYCLPRSIQSRQYQRHVPSSLG